MKKFLIVNPFGIGDTIFTMSLAEALRRAVPDAEIGFLCNERTVDLVRLHAAVDHTYEFNRDRFRRLWRKNPRLFLTKLSALLGLVREPRYDALIDLSLGRQYAFFGMLCGIRRRVGYDYRSRGTFLTRKVRLAGYAGRGVAAAQIELLGLLGLPPVALPGKLSIRVPASARADVDAFLKRRGVGPGEKLLVVAPGGGKTWGKNAHYKQWDPGRFGEAAIRLCRSHSFRAVFVGSADERALVEETAAASEVPSSVFCGEPLERTAALLERASLVLANDGGLLHLANALGTPVVGIYGPVDDAVYGPAGTAAHRVVKLDVPCRPCYKDFRFPECPHARRCLADLPVEAVVKAAEEIA